MCFNVFEFYIGTQPGVHPVSDADGAPSHLDFFQLAENLSPLFHIQYQSS
jgi:hypothetical protein